MHLCLNKFESKVWKENCPIFLYKMYKAGRKSESFPNSFLVVFPSLVMQQISSNAYMLLVSFDPVPYMQISDIFFTHFI